MALIQVDSMAYQAATATPVGSTSMETTGTGGRFRSPVPTLGNVNCTSATTLSTEATSFGTTASQLVASGIKNFKL